MRAPAADRVRVQRANGPVNEAWRGAVRCRERVGQAGCVRRLQREPAPQGFLARFQHGRGGARILLMQSADRACGPFPVAVGEPEVERDAPAEDAYGRVGRDHYDGWRQMFDLVGVRPGHRADLVGADGAQQKQHLDQAARGRCPLAGRVPLELREVDGRDDTGERAGVGLGDEQQKVAYGLPVPGVAAGDGQGNAVWVEGARKGTRGAALSRAGPAATQAAGR